MLETEQVERYRRELAALARAVGADDPAALAKGLELLAEASDQMLDAASDLRADGYSWRALAVDLGVTRASVKERFGCRPRALELERFTRRVTIRAVNGMARDVTMPGRLSTAGRLVVAAVKGLPWVVVRRCGTDAEAAELAAYLAENTEGWAYVKKPRDLRAADYLTKGE